MSKELTQAERDDLRRECGLPTDSEIIAKFDAILERYASLRMGELINLVIDNWGDTYVLQYSDLDADKLTPLVVYEITTGDLVASGCYQIERRMHFNPVFDARWC